MTVPLNPVATCKPTTTRQTLTHSLTPAEAVADAMLQLLSTIHEKVLETLYAMFSEDPTGDFTIRLKIIKHMEKVCNE